MVKEKEQEKGLVIPTDEKALQELMKPALGTEEITSEDIVMPRIRLLQDQSNEVKSKEESSGKLKHSLSGDVYESVEFIPLTMHKSRIMFDTDNRNGAPLCRSNNNTVGSDGTKCKECENAQWKNNKPPVCNMIFNYLVLQTKEVGQVVIPSILSFMKTSTEAALKLNMSVEITLPRQPFWNKVWKVTPRMKPFKKGEAYILDVQQVRDTTKDERAWCELVYKSTVGKKVDLVADDLPIDDIIEEK